MGGALAGLERGFQQKEIADAAYIYQMAVEEKREIVVGVNAYAVGRGAADGGPADRSRRPSASRWSGSAPSASGATPERAAAAVRDLTTPPARTAT